MCLIQFRHRKKLGMRSQGCAWAFGPTVPMRQAMIVMPGNHTCPCVPVSLGGSKALTRTENYKNNCVPPPPAQLVKCQPLHSVLRTPDFAFPAPRLTPPGEGTLSTPHRACSSCVAHPRQNCPIGLRRAAKGGVPPCLANNLLDMSVHSWVSHVRCVVRALPTGPSNGAGSGRS